MRIRPPEKPLGACHHGSIFKTRCRFGVHAANVDGIALCCMLNSAIADKGLPKRLSSDNDPLFRYHQWQANLRILEIEEVKSVPYTPTSHPFIERLIGTIRREYLDRLFFWNAQDLERKLACGGRITNYRRNTTSCVVLFLRSISSILRRYEGHIYFNGASVNHHCKAFRKRWRKVNCC
jgi:transposase InsO family protein